MYCGKIVMSLSLLLLSWLTLKANDSGLLGCWKGGTAEQPLLAEAGREFPGKATGVEVKKVDNQNVLDFNGRDSSISLTIPEKLNAGFTFSAWVNLRGDGAIVSRPGFHNYLGCDRQRFVFECWTADNKAVTVYSTKPHARNEWKFVTGVYDPDKKRLLLYVDGVLENSIPFPGQIMDYGPQFYFGCGRPTRLHLDGMIGEIRIYRRALSGDEIKKQYEDTANRYKSGIGTIVSISQSPWKLCFDRETGIMLELSWKEVLLISNPSGRKSVDLGHGAFKLQTHTWNSSTRQLVLSLVAGDWRLQQIIQLGTLERPNRISCGVSFVHRPPQPTTGLPPQFHNLQLSFTLPKQGKYLVPGCFLGDNRGITQIEKDLVEPDPSDYAGSCDSIPSGRYIGNAAYLNWLIWEPRPKLQVLFMADERRDPVSVGLSAGSKDIQALFNINACGWAEPGQLQRLAPVYLEVCEADGPLAALREVAPRWYDDIGFRIPADRPDWVYRSMVFMHPGGSPESYQTDRGGLGAAEHELLPRFKQLGFGSVMVWSLGEGMHPTNPGDYFTIARNAGNSWDDFRRFVASAHRDGLKVFKYVIPHGGTPPAGQLRGNNAAELIYDRQGNAKTYWCFDMMNPDWQNYFSGVIDFYMRFGVDGIGIDAPGSLIPNWRRSGFPAANRVPGNVPADWWLDSLQKLGGEMPALPYERASLGTREGGMRMCRAIRDTARKHNPQAVTVAEQLNGIYAQDNDIIVDFMFARLFRKLAESRPEVFVAEVSRWLEEQQLAYPPGFLPLRYMNIDTNNRARGFLGLGAYHSLMALLFWSRGVPMVVQDCLGDGVMLQSFNRIRNQLPEMQYGTASYLTVKADHPGVFTVLRQLDDKVSVAVVNMTATAVNARLDIPTSHLPSAIRLTQWDMYNQKKLKTGIREEFGISDISLPAWGSTVLTWRPANSSAPVEFARPADNKTLLSTATSPRVTETTENITIDNSNYELVIDRGSGLIRSFKNASGTLVLGPSDIVSDRVPSSGKVKISLYSDRDMPVVKAELPSGVLIIYQAAPDRIMVDASLVGEKLPPTVALSFSAPDAGRYWINAAEGIVEDWTVPRSLGKTRHHELYSLRLTGSPVVWQAETQPLDLNNPSIRFGANTNAITMTLANPLTQAPANVLVTTRLGTQESLQALFCWRQPGSPECRRFSLVLNPFATNASQAAAPVAVGKLNLRCDSLGWVVDSPYYKIKLSRTGGNIRELSDATKTLLSKQSVYSDRGLYREAQTFNSRGIDSNAFRASNLCDYETGIRIWQDGQVLRMRFTSRLMASVTNTRMPCRIWCVTEYAFDGSSPSFRCNWSLRFDGALTGLPPFLSWAANLTPGIAVQFPGNTDSATPALRFDDLSESAPEPLKKPYLDKNRLYIPWLDSSSGQPVLRRWYQAGMIITAGAEKHPAPSIPWLAEPDSSVLFDTSFETGAAMYSSRTGKPSLLQLPTAAPGDWKVVFADADTTTAHDGAVSLKLADSAFRYPLAPDTLEPGKYLLRLWIKGQGLEANGKPVRTWLDQSSGVHYEAPVKPSGTVDIAYGYYDAKGQIRSFNQTLELQGSFDWREIVKPFELKETCHAPFVRVGFLHAYGGNIWIDNIKLEKKQ